MGRKVSIQSDSALKLPWALGAGLLLLGPTFTSAAQIRLEPPGPSAIEREASGDVRVFAIPETRDARALRDRAEGHIQSERWLEAVLDLQRLILNHSSDVLSARSRDNLDRVSLYDVHPGAATWATERLGSLPAPALKLYTERFEKNAEAALRIARERGDRRALVRVAQTWPLTEAAERAWWTLGDLEFERGQITDALRAWTRAAERHQKDGGDLPPAAKRRFELVQSGLEGGLDGVLREPVAARSKSELRLPGPNESFGNVPEDYADAWSVDLPPNPFDDKHAHASLFPVLSDERVLVSTSMNVLCVDAYTGQLKWVSDPVPGWSDSNYRELTRGIDDQSGLIAPAVSGSVVVAPLQVPFARLPFSNYQGIRITVPIPNRRLFAFDLESGEPLWNHMPPPLWDGEGGSYTDRMMLAGPPIISGSRVLAPFYLMQGRVDFQVACFDLYSGELLWNTALISGQRELNMFGRHEQEFCAPPLRAEGGRVIALTQLGTVAALDLDTGRILWESLYEQIPLPRTRGWTSPSRIKVWRNAPPVVADGTVIVTPLDSYDMVGFDLEHGTALWSTTHSWLDRDPDRGIADSSVSLLLGADRDTVYLGGSKISAHHRPGGLALGQPDQRLWSYGIERSRGDELYRSPRPVLASDALVVPVRSGRQIFDRRTGMRRGHGGPTDHALSRGGNILVGEGMLFTLSSNQLSGYFDWEVLQARAQERLRANPNDLVAVLSLAQVLLQRGVVQHQSGDASQALQHLTEAHQLLAPMLTNEFGKRQSEVASRLHQVLREEAKVRASLADTRLALELLDRARELTSDSGELRDLLFEQERLLREREGPEWLACLNDLEESCGELEAPSDQWSFALPEIDPDSAPMNLSVELWVLFVRSRLNAERGRSMPALEDLHSALERYGSNQLDWKYDVYDLASARIQALLDDQAARGARTDYAFFEDRARRLYEDALRDDSTQLLERVRALYPHSKASSEASQALLSRAHSNGDTEDVVRLVRESATGTRIPSELDAWRWALVATALEQENPELCAGLLASLDRSLPGLSIELGEDPARSLAELSRAYALPALQPSAAERSTFDESLTRTSYFDGIYRNLGYLPKYDAKAHDQVVFTRQHQRDTWVESHSSKNPSRALWGFQLSSLGSFSARDTSSVLTSNRVVLAGSNSVVAIDAQEGYLVWQHRLRSYDLLGMSGHGGVVILLLADDAGSTFARAIDSGSGLELWDRALPQGSAWLPPLCDGDRALFPTISHSTSQPARAIVLNLYRGAELGQIDLEGRLNQDSYRAAWIEDGLFVLPTFLAGSKPERNHILCFDLKTMQRKWRHSFRDGQELSHLVRAESETYLVLRTGDSESGAGNIVQLDLQLGALRPIASLRSDERPIGLPERTRTELGGPFLYLYTNGPGQRSVPISAIHLPYGKRWVSPLPVSYEQLYDGGMTLPALSSQVAALAYTSKIPDERTWDQAHLILLDRNGGVRRDSRVLPREFGRAEILTLIPLGSALFILRNEGLHGNLMEVWVNEEDK